MNHNRLKELVIIHKISDTNLLFFDCTDYKFYVYHYSRDELDEKYDRKKGTSLQTVVIISFIVLLRVLSKYSSPEYLGLRILILLLLSLIVGTVFYVLLLNSDEMKKLNMDENWTEETPDGSCLKYYFKGFKKLHYQTHILTLILTFITIVIGIIYMYMGNPIIIVIYLLPSLITSIILSGYSFRSYHVAKKQIMQLIENEDN